MKKEVVFPAKVLRNNNSNSSFRVKVPKLAIEHLCLEVGETVEVKITKLLEKEGDD